MTNLKDTATQIRRDIVRMVHAVQSGHPGGSLGCTEYLTALYFDVMKHDPKFNMDGVGEDVFFLSNGHISPVFYSVLARSGYFPIEELSTFRKLKFMEWLGRRCWSPFGGVYMLVAQAKVIPLTPIKLSWKQKVTNIQLAPIGVPRPTIRDRLP